MEEFNNQISIPFGDTPDQMLKLFRENVPVEEYASDMKDAAVDTENRYQTIIQVNSFIEFEPVLKESL